MRKVNVCALRMALLALLVLNTSIGARAAVFNIVYDDLADNTISNIVGTGTLSFDGPASLGGTALSALTNLTFSATFDSGQSFDTDDIATDLGLSGIFVFDTGGGNLGLVFTGNGGLPSTGSFDLENENFQILTHEPTPGGIDDPLGCCGGDGFVNFYAADLFFGDYQATLVPLPAAVWFLLGGLGSLFALRRR